MTFERLSCQMLMPNVIVNNAGGLPSLRGVRFTDAEYVDDLPQ